MLLLPTLLLIIPAVFSLTLSPPTGPFNTTISHLGFRDSMRRDPFDPTSGARDFAATLFFPINGSYCLEFCELDYMPTRTASVTSAQFFGNTSSSATTPNEAKGFFEDITTQACCESTVELNTDDYPVVFFEPALGTSRLLYSAIAQEIASYGFSVFVMDHPHDSSIVEFSYLLSSPSNTTIYQSVPIDALSASAATTYNDTLVQTRIGDIQSILNLMGNSYWTDQLGSDYVGSFGNRLKGFAVIGHGLGGAQGTFMEMGNLTSIAINMGGTAPPLSNDTTSPIVFFGRQGARRENDPNWMNAWPHFKGYAAEFDMRNAGMYDYSDLPWLIAQKGGVNKASVKGLGSVDAKEAFAITTHFARAYVEAYLEDKEYGMEDLSAGVRAYPDMVPYPGV